MAFPGPQSILLQAAFFGIAGAWLLWRSMDPQALPMRWLLHGPSSLHGRASRPWWALLLFVVVGLLIEMLGLTFWLDTDWWGVGQTVIVILVTGYLAVVHPRFAADLALAGLVLFGLYGVALTLLWPNSIPLPAPYTDVVRYGAFIVDSRSWAIAAGLQGLGFIGVGLWLTPRALDDRTKALFRTATEAELSSRVVRLANAVKHSGAKSAQVRLWQSDGALKITVVDDGSGGADPRGGSGLLGLERRLGVLDGVLAVSSPPGGPTIIAIDVPCSFREAIGGPAGRHR